MAGGKTPLRSAKEPPTRVNALSGYWLLKTEPDCYSIADLARDGRTMWTGVRNYQARNYMRDTMRVGDGVLIYHSSQEPIGVAGLARISRTDVADATALDPNDDHYDSKATPDEPIWICAEVEFVHKFTNVVTLAALKADPALRDMLVLKRGQRLSVMPVAPAHFDRVAKLGGA